MKKMTAVCFGLAIGLGAAGAALAQDARCDMNGYKAQDGLKARALADGVALPGPASGVRSCGPHSRYATASRL